MLFTITATFTAKIPEKLYLKPIRWSEKVDKWNNISFLKNYDRGEVLYQPDEQMSLRSKVNQILFDNKPTKVKFEGLCGGHYRNNDIGYTVRYNNVLVKLDNSVFFEALEEGFSMKDEYLPGEYIFVKYNKSFMLTKVGSTPHLAALAQIEKAKNEKLNVKSLNVGNVYEAANSSRALFLGFVSTEKMLQLKNTDNIQIKFLPKNLCTLWMPVSNLLKREQIETFLKENINNNFSYAFKVKNTHSFRAKVDEIEKIILPERVIMNIRNMANKRFELSSSSQELKFMWDSEKLNTTKKYLLQRLSRDSELLNMVPYGATPMRSSLLFPIEKYEVK